MIVVDASPLIHFSKIGKLQLLRRVYGTILIPRGVWNEVVADTKGRPGASEVERAVEEGWAKTVKVSVPRVLEADGAEGADAEVVALARERGLPVLSNDRVLASLARTHGVRVKWLTQTVVEAVDAKVLSPSEGRAVIRDLVRAGLRVRSDTLAEIIHSLEEAEKKT